MVAQISLVRRPLHQPGGTGIVVSRGNPLAAHGEVRYRGVRWLVPDGLLTSADPTPENETQVGTQRVFSPGEVDAICQHARGRWIATRDVTAYRLIHGMFGLTLELRHQHGATQRLGVDFAFAVHESEIAALLEHRP